MPNDDTRSVKIEFSVTEEHAVYVSWEDWQFMCVQLEVDPEDLDAAYSALDSGRWDQDEMLLGLMTEQTVSRTGDPTMTDLQIEG